jgi:hypothetical protein
LVSGITIFPQTRHLGVGRAIVITGDSQFLNVGLGVSRFPDPATTRASAS